MACDPNKFLHSYRVQKSIHYTTNMEMSVWDTLLTLVLALGSLSEVRDTYRQSYSEFDPQILLANNGKKIGIFSFTGFK